MPRWLLSEKGILRYILSWQYPQHSVPFQATKLVAKQVLWHGQEVLWDSLLPFERLQLIFYTRYGGDVPGIKHHIDLVRGSEISRTALPEIHIQSIIGCRFTAFFDHGVPWRKRLVSSSEGSSAHLLPT